MKKNSKYGVGIALVVIAGVLLFAYTQGYIPWLTTPPEKPDVIPVQECETWFTNIKTKITHMTDVNTEMYQSTQSAENIITYYEDVLTESGFHLICPEDLPEIITDECFKGQVEIETFNTHYAGYIKGWTVAVVLAAEHTPTASGSCVVFTYGAIWDYEQILKDIVEGYIP